MKKIIKTNFLKSLVILGVASSLVLTSCYKDIEPDYPAQGLKPVVSFSSAAYSVAEGKELEITLVTNQVLNDNMEFQLDVVKTSSTATDVDDVEIGLDGVDIDWGTKDSYMITFPKFQDSYTFSINAILDDLLEGEEVAYLKIVPRGNLNGEVGLSETMVTIMQRGSNIIDLTFDWEKSFMFGGTNYTLCQIGYDVDFLLATPSGTILDYIAGTAACPEVGEIDVDALGAGTYQILVNIYDNGGLSGAAITPAFLIPVTMTYTRGGSALNGSYVQPSTYAVNSNFASDPSGANNKYLVSFTIAANGIVTFFDVNTSTTIASGKNSTPKYTGFENLPKRIK